MLLWVRHMGLNVPSGLLQLVLIIEELTSFTLLNTNTMVVSGITTATPTTTVTHKSLEAANILCDIETF